MTRMDVVECLVRKLEPMGIHRGIDRRIPPDHIRVYGSIPATDIDSEAPDVSIPTQVGPTGRMF